MCLRDASKDWLVACVFQSLQFMDCQPQERESLQHHDCMARARLCAVSAEVLKDVLSPSDHIWFQERFQEAAIKRYGCLQAACNEAVGSGLITALLLLVMMCLF